jgi:mRNA-degrading endonuclease RelE of RelBE toxin-antitoxin system
MTRYTLTYSTVAQAEMARAWLTASNRQAVTDAIDGAERELSRDANDKGVEVSEGLRRLDIPPVRLQFSVEEDDRTVTVWSVRLIST